MIETDGPYGGGRKKRRPANPVAVPIHDCFVAFLVFEALVLIFYFSVCNSKNHSHHHGLLDSQYWQMRLQAEQVSPTIDRSLSAFTFRSLSFTAVPQNEAAWRIRQRARRLLPAWLQQDDVLVKRPRNNSAHKLPHTNTTSPSCASNLRGSH